MKRLFLILTLLCGAFSLHAQEQLYKELSSLDGVTTAYISKSMFRQMADFNLMGIKLGPLFKKIDQLYTVSVEERPDLVTTVRDILRKQVINNKEYQLLMDVSDESEKARIYAKGTKKKHIYILVNEQNASDISIVMLTGSLTLSDFKNLATSFIE